MPKQYTFKTTKSTSYIEEILDNLGSSERSDFIRNAILSYASPQNNVTQMSHKSNTNVSQMSHPTYDEPYVPVKHNKEPISSPEIQVIKEEAMDLDAVLNKLYN